MLPPFCFVMSPTASGLLYLLTPLSPLIFSGLSEAMVQSDLQWKSGVPSNGLLLVFFQEHNDAPVIIVLPPLPRLLADFRIEVAAFYSPN